MVKPITDAAGEKTENTAFMSLLLLFSSVLLSSSDTAPSEVL